MIQVADIPAASRWYQDVAGFVSGHGGDEFEMLFAGTPYESPLLLQLHRWEADEHGFLGDPTLPIGNGASLWFEVDDLAEFEARWAVVSATARDRVLSEPAWNPLAHHHEFAVSDLDGYAIAFHTPFSAD